MVHSIKGPCGRFAALSLCLSLSLSRARILSLSLLPTPPRCCVLYYILHAYSFLICFDDSDDRVGVHLYVNDSATIEMIVAPVYVCVRVRRPPGTMNGTCSPPDASAISNLRRCAGDAKDSWGSMMSILEEAAAVVQYSLTLTLCVCVSVRARACACACICAAVHDPWYNHPLFGFLQKLGLPQSLALSLSLSRSLAGSLALPDLHMLGTRAQASSPTWTF